ncbi:MAG: hypothetical protein JNL14_01670 [Devosia sp.]|uniref:hypothetical protein n=1 Tax=Devosia sp. TaxID=1871048 RepID=UPI001A40556F|nr:hypothetical protein [Devosia sp.]MBL8596425.1 hypothetical protein [Devosia sp.]
MQVSEYDLDQRQGRRVPSPGCCIYCRTSSAGLTDEHVVPYALGAHTLVLEESCCPACQEIIQPYEQEVLRRQLGVFRAQVDAPTRNKKDRPSSVRMHFVEVGDDGTVLRDLGYRPVPLEEVPLSLNLWSSPPPRLLMKVPSRDVGRAWTYFDQKAVASLCQKVRAETGANHVAVKTGDVNRKSYLRSLAKMAHAYASAELGLDSFEPLLEEIILDRSDDIEKFVGDAPAESPMHEDPAHTVRIAIGETVGEEAGGYLVATIQLYPMLKSPVHMVVFGRPLIDIGARFSPPA